MRSHYWSCSKFADWIRGTKKLSVGSAQEWDQWESDSKVAHPIRHWIAEEALDRLQSFVMWPIDQVYSFKYWINNRFVTRTHALTSTLKKGQWHDLDTRILHCLFDELVNYVEIELAASNFRWDKEAREKHKVPFWAIGWFRWRTYRNVEAAMEYLDWASELRYTVNEVGEGNDLIGQLTSQAVYAREVKILYNWWKNVRPARPDPHEASGWSAYCSELREESGSVNYWLSKVNESEEDTNVEHMLNVIQKMEARYEKEDDRMLAKLIKIRRGLWT
jgi:hypothetical protein